MKRAVFILALLLMVINIFFSGCLNHQTQGLIISSFKDFDVIDVFVQENYAYLTCDDGFRIIDIRNPYSPKYVGGLDIPGAYHLFICGDYAYVTCSTMSNDSLQIINITNPLNPILISSIIVDRADRVYVDEKFAYVTGGNNLKIIDIIDKSNPVRIKTVNITSGYSQGVIVYGNYVYLGNTTGLNIVDISELEKSHIVGFLDIDEQACNLDVIDNRVYLANWNKGLTIINVSNPNKPLLETSVLDTRCIAADDIQIYSGKVFLTMSNPTGVGIIDLRSLKLIKTIETPGCATNLFVKDQYLYIADGHEGLQIAMY